MADQELNVTVRVNKETGQLEVVRSELKGLGQDVEKLGKTSETSKQAVGGLMSSITDLASKAAVLAFFKTAIDEFSETEEAWRKIGSNMNALGLAFDENRPKIEAWTQAMQDKAHMEDTAALTALNTAIERTKDYGQAMKLVQLSQDIAISGNKNFKTVLDSVTQAAGGSQGALQKLKMEFGAQLQGVTTNQEALNKLAAVYGGSAEKAQSFKLGLTDIRNELGDVAKEVAGGFIPALQEGWAAFGGTAMVTLRSVGTAVGGLFSLVISGLSTSAQIFRSIVEGVVTVVFDLVTGRFRKAKEDAGKVLGEIVDITRKESGKMSETFFSTLDNLGKVYSGAKEAHKSALAEMNDFTAAATEKDKRIVLSELEQRLQVLKQSEQLSLANKMLSEEQRISIIRQYAQMEIDEVLRTKAEIGDAELQSGERISQIHQDTELKIINLKQRAAENWKQGLDDWYRHGMNVNARFADTGKQAFDSLANSMGAATAKMIMHGASFTKTFESMFKAMAEQVIAQIVAIIAKWMVLNALTGGGVSLTKVLGLAEGGRVDKPTLAVIGEGGEGETVVPDSKAKTFAMGVLAAGAGDLGPVSSKPAGGGGTAGGGTTVILNLGGVTINAGGGHGDIYELARVLLQGFNEETAEYVRLALTMDNVATKYSGRAP